MFHFPTYNTLDLTILDKTNRKYNLFNENTGKLDVDLIDSSKPLTISVWARDIKTPVFITYNNDTWLNFTEDDEIRKNEIYSKTVSPGDSLWSDIVDKFDGEKIKSTDLHNIAHIKITQYKKHSHYTPNMNIIYTENFTPLRKYGISPVPKINHDYYCDKLNHYFRKYIYNENDRLLRKIESYYNNVTFPDIPRHDHDPRKKISIFRHHKSDLYMYKSYTLRSDFVSNSKYIYRLIDVWRLKYKYNGIAVSKNYIEFRISIIKKLDGTLNIGIINTLNKNYTSVTPTFTNLNKLYIGFSQDETLTSTFDELENNGETIMYKADPSGTYEVTNSYNEGAYLWISTTYPKPIRIFSNGFEIPIVSSTISNNTYCYRSESILKPHQMSFELKTS